MYRDKEGRKKKKGKKEPLLNHKSLFHYVSGEPQLIPGHIVGWYLCRHTLRSWGKRVYKALEVKASKDSMMAYSFSNRLNLGTCETLA